MAHFGQNLYRHPSRPELADGNLSGVRRRVQTCSCDAHLHPKIPWASELGKFAEEFSGPSNFCVQPLW